MRLGRIFLAGSLARPHAGAMDNLFAADTTHIAVTCWRCQHGVILGHDRPRKILEMI